MAINGISINLNTHAKKEEEDEDEKEDRNKDSRKVERTQSTVYTKNQTER